MLRYAIALAAFPAVFALGADSALATAGMVCDGLDNKDVFVEMNLPRSSGSPPNWVRVGTPQKNFSTLGMDEGAIPLIVKQAFDDGQTFNIDLADDGATEALVRVRLLMAEEGDDPPLYVGYVHVVGQGIYPISCSEDE